MKENIISTEEKELIKLPKNIRQIGQATEEKRIYIEDYVVTFLHRYYSSTGNNIFILVGKRFKYDEKDIIFVNGMIRTEYGYLDSKMTEETENEINNEIDKYFPEEEIMGWAVVSDDWDGTNESIYNFHRENFSEKLFLVYDTFEKEEIFYSNDLNEMLRIKGFYIYYDKNEAMQNYMLDEKDVKSNEFDYKEETLEKIRTVFDNKNTANEISNKNSDDKKDNGSFSARYAMVMLCAVAVLTLGANKIDDIKSLKAEDVQVIFQKASDVKEKWESDIKKSEKEMSGELEVKEIKGSIVSQMPISTAEAESVFSDNLTEKIATEAPTETVKVTIEPTVIPTTEPTQKTEKTSTVRYHVVQKGESLVSISKKIYGDSRGVEIIKKANGIEDEDKIIVGQKLLIPENI